MKIKTPLLAITMGDPAGIGPEIALRAVLSFEKPLQTKILIIGSMDILKATARQLSFSQPMHSVLHPSDMISGSINIVDVREPVLRDYVIGKPQPQCGLAAYNYIIKGIEMALAKHIDAVVTCPINKEALKMAGIPYPGHTEIFADKTHSPHYSMMFACDNVYVVHVTTHVSLKQAITQITKEHVLEHTRLLNEALKNLGIKNPRIAIAGLNPHAGENGMFGDEEIIHIRPAVEQAIHEGINAKGPYPPDTVFMRAFSGEFDGVVSMLHDHGFVALKSRNFDDGVNITLGLPIIRTSVGHGTAYDIAGKGIASEKSLIAALHAACQMASHRHNYV
jgi:4-hydroxythreonine-4-phosphate dehydrogenase